MSLWTMPVEKWLRVILLISLLSGGAEAALGQAAISNFSVVTNLSQLRHATSRAELRICSINLEATVLAVNSDLNLVFLVDDSGAEALEMNMTASSLLPGERLFLVGTNCVTQTENGLSLRISPVVDNDGLHALLKRSGTVYLSAGRHPITVLWFNRTASALLGVACSVPKSGTNNIANSELSRVETKTGGLSHLQGLNFRCFEGEWQKLPDFASMTPVKTGSVTNFDVTVRSRGENVGLEFKGLFEAAHEGVYTFYLESDDGSQLFLYDTPPRIVRSGKQGLPEPRRIPVSQPLAADQSSFYGEVEATVSFVSKQRGSTELELTSYGTRMRVRVLEGAEPPPNLLRSRVRVQGVCLNTCNTEGQAVAGLLLAPNWRNLQVLNEPLSEQGARTHEGTNFVNTQSQNYPLSTVSTVLESSSIHAAAPGKSPTNGLPLLTTAAQVQQLKRTEPERVYPVKIRGVVTWMSERGESMFLQDSTRAVFVWIGATWEPSLPHLGEYVEIEGTSHAGDFAPLVAIKSWTRLGAGQLPPPVLPTWDQLISGSLDSQYVEIRGYVTAVHSDRITLLLPGGLLDFTVFPLSEQPFEPLLNALVRVRGCLFPNWNQATHQVVIDLPIKLRNAIISVDTTPPADPFVADSVHAVELTRFDVQADFFRRAKIACQILHGSGGMYYAMDQGIGLRFQPAQPALVQAGDNVEVVGFVELGGASPVLRQAFVRKTGHASLPEARELVLDPISVNKDSTRVWVEAVLVSVKDSDSELTLELQSGLKSFIARLQTSERPAARWIAGSRLKLTGVFSTSEGRARERNVGSFELLLNSPADVQVVALPPRWTMGRLLIVVGFLAAFLALASTWIHVLRRQVESRTVRLEREIGERERAEQGRAIEVERSRIARDIHDEVGASLTKISKLTEMMDHQAGGEVKDGAFTRTIANTARETIQAMDEIVWAVNPKNDTLREMADYLVHFTEEFVQPTGISCCLEVPLSLPDLPVTAEVRHNLFMVVKEALNNAVKHGASRHIKLGLALSEDWLTLEVADDGTGFDLERSAGAGNGLENMKKRLSAIGGELLLQTERGQGTAVKLRVSLRQNGTTPLKSIA